MVEGEGFEPSKAYAGRFTVCSLWPLGNPSRFRLSGAGGGNRTRDLPLTRRLLYQLSYTSDDDPAATEIARGF